LSTLVLRLSFTLAFDPSTVHIDSVRDAMLSARIPTYASMIRGVRLFADAPRGSGIVASTVRSIVRANPLIDTMDALALALAARTAAAHAGLDRTLFVATLLQESGFDPAAFSTAGACGIAQFMPATARGLGIDPFDPTAAIAASATLLRAEVDRYADARESAYVLAFAAYNAGDGAVTYYHGVPPYPETREYIDDIIERAARLIAQR